MKDKATFQNKVKVLNKLFDSGCDTEKKLQQLDMEAILKIPNITIPDMGVIMELQKNTKSGKLLNKAIRRIIRDCNDEQFLKTENPEVLLPHFSCHSLRHTFTTRMCEAGVNIKVIQDTLGHKDITTTLNIYTDVTKELKKTEFEGLDKYFDNSIA
ncbi:tyrosine-type recombinase/integrase [Lactonifactor sp. BIOML-A3]|uniref:tyrosine-type recombinase/integrase n=1 Tax=unclassified Lactonifactor TaxID=2636670 RepID=UPI00130C0D08|nr:tyrosine-type recombinase/integrase [Lactonifactor sp. BIOML-A5]MSA07038.1 tyrosine-type recombinase/integrase [Lactonifactor sp. BIOML-A4]MSA11677.1 tyrosine-type recombinase/integrase [Lactonifactor sp. BIOML-A3]MSA16270.1 tyrosine-type recombinase/integrase [Lactonifactor sp. BIOML-A2]MSA36874.1 tyrosine-type recombinase/integrase [Lactonifactor sp. BIOML-A1]MSB12724.1 tyrosine-type recombinase/integrase [Lactonifactor sp. BIOML-A6]MSB68088.1 tyrosine-type recombinase/integrase [Lactoni